jgi:hypothetical protein
MWASSVYAIIMTTQKISINSIISISLQRLWVTIQYNNTPQCPRFACLSFPYCIAIWSWNSFSNQVDRDIILSLKPEKTTHTIASRVGISIITVSHIRYMHSLKVSLQAWDHTGEILPTKKRYAVQIATYRLLNIAVEAENAIIL